MKNNGKVEICGVNTAHLKVLSDKETKELLLKSKSGDKRESSGWSHYLRGS